MSSLSLVIDCPKGPKGATPLVIKRRRRPRPPATGKGKNYWQPEKSSLSWLDSTYLLFDKVGQLSSSQCFLCPQREHKEQPAGAVFSVATSNKYSEFSLDDGGQSESVWCSHDGWKRVHGAWRRVGEGRTPGSCLGEATEEGMTLMMMTSLNIFSLHY